VHLTPHEQERLLIHVAADVARRRKYDPNRTIPLNYPEAVALITAYVLEEARAGVSVATLMQPVPTTVLAPSDLMPGVEEMLRSGLQIEATFPDGTMMVSVRDPLGRITTQSTPSRVHPGKIEHPTGAPDVEFNVHLRPPTIVSVTNTDSRAIQVGSHYHFFEVNPYLEIKEQPDWDPLPDSPRDSPTDDELKVARDFVRGMRLNIPAGKSRRFEPHCAVEVDLVPIEGNRNVWGLRGMVKDNLDNSQGGSTPQ
jgi:urease subunit gamma/beta